MVVLPGTQGNLGAFRFDVVSRGGLCVLVARRVSGSGHSIHHRHETGQPHV
jgi:hypothetical protein